MNYTKIWPFIVVIAVIGLIFYNIDGWLVEDDEGTALYASWRYTEGEEPYIDFSTTNPPLFLSLGKAAVQTFGRNILPLRSISALSIIAGVTILTLAIKSIWGSRIALLVWSCTLLTPQVYELARVFRADSIMIALICVGLALALLEIRQRKRIFLMLAGILLGLAMTTKVLAIMPFLGILMWLTIRRIPDREWPAIIKDNISFGVPAASVLILSYGLLELRLPGTLAMIAGAQGESLYEVSYLWRFVKGLVGWIVLFMINPLLLIASPLAPLTIIRHRWNQERLFWATQVAGMLPIFVIGGPVYPRYLAYLTPSLLALFFIWLAEQKIDLPKVKSPYILLAALALPLLFAVHQRERLYRSETDTVALTEWVAEHTEPDAVVVSDYAELNFHAGRRSIPIQPSIGQNWAATGLITGELLREQMEEKNAAMLLLHIPGGPWEPYHLSSLQDYDEFLDYLDTYYEPVEYWNRAGQLIEIWQRK